MHPSIYLYDQSTFQCEYSQCFTFIKCNKIHTFIAIEKDRYGLQKTVLKHVNLPLYYRYDEGKYSPRKQVLTDCWPAMPLPSLISLKKWCYWFKKILKANLWRTSIELPTWTSSRRLLDSTSRVAAIFEQRNKPMTRNSRKDDWFDRMKKLGSWVPSESWNWRQFGKTAAMMKFAIKFCWL